MLLQNLKTIKLEFSEQINSNSIINFINNLLPEGKGLDFVSGILQISKANKCALIDAIENETAGALTFSPNSEITTSFREISDEELTQRIIDRENTNITGMVK